MSSPASEPSHPSHSSLSCKDMTEGMVHCDEVAWTSFHQLYFDWLYTCALLRGCSHGEADDIVQLTYLRAVRHIKIFETESDLKNWLSCLMRCVVIDRARKVNRRNILIEKFALWQELRKEPNQVISDIDPETIHEALASLSLHDTQLIKLKYADGWSTKELAERNQTTPKAIESKLARLRTRLKTNLTKTG